MSHRYSCASAVVLAFFVLVSGLAASGFTIIHSNDRHGYVEKRKDVVSGRWVAGLDVAASMMKSIEFDSLVKGRPCLLVDAGDLFQGTPVVNETRGASMIELYNAMRYELVTFGNHEFDYGWRTLERRMSESRFLWISTTVWAPRLKKFYRPWVTVCLAGTKVAFLGATTTTTPEKQISDKIEGISFRRPEDVLPSVIDRLRADHGVKVFVLLSHLGVEADRKLARTCPGLDLIIGGHSHTVLKEPLRIGRTWIAQTGAYSRFIGVLYVDLDSDGRVETVRGGLREVLPDLWPADPGIADIIGKYRRTIDAKLETVVGRASVNIPKGVDGSWSPMAQLTAAAFRSALGADLAFMNTGGVRRGLLAGPIRVRDLQMAVPYRNYLVSMKLYGRQIRHLLETAVDGDFVRLPSDKAALLRSRGLTELDGLVPSRGGTGFLVPDGLRFVFDPRRKPGERMISIDVAGRPLDDSKTYLVATNDFLADGGDGFETFKKGRSVKLTGIMDWEAVRRYFSSFSSVSVPGRSNVVNLSFSAVEKRWRGRRRRASKADLFQDDCPGGGATGGKKACRISAANDIVNGRIERSAAREAIGRAGAAEALLASGGD